MTGARQFAKQRERQRSAGLKERREYERARLLDEQDARLANMGRERAADARKRKHVPQS